MKITNQTVINSDTLTDEFLKQFARQNMEGWDFSSVCDYALNAYIHELTDQRDHGIEKDLIEEIQFAIENF